MVEASVTEASVAEAPVMHRGAVRPSPASFSIALDLALGAAAGAAAVWVMDRVDWFMFLNEDPRARRHTQRVREGGEDPAHVLAARLERMTGTRLSRDGHHVAGQAIHYGIGIAPAALYGALRDRVPYLGAGRGALYGLGMFVVEDEVANPVAGLARGPFAYLWQAHARGLVAHLVLGVVTDAAFSLLRGLVGDRRRPA